MLRLKVGDVVQERNGAWRIVRAVTRQPSGKLCAITLTIRHCSWTGRCYTVIMANDLRQRGFHPVRVRRRKLTSRFDRKIQRAIHGNEDRRVKPYSVTCCDVEGTA
jgi:hypothetical protein